MDRHTKSLVRYGLAIHWLNPRSKAPIGNNWASKPVATIEQLEDSYRDGNNIGARLGKWSKTAHGYIHVLDLDIRNPKMADECWESLHEMFPKLNLKKTPTVISGSRGESRHLYFVTSEPFNSKKLSHSEENFTDAAGKKHWNWEIELFGTGKQVAIPPSIHPDTGKEYLWDIELDASGNIPHIDADHLADLIYAEEISDEDTNSEATGISYDEAEAYLKDLDLDLWCEDREGWIKTGMALHHEFSGARDAFDVWKDFSKQSKKFDLAVLKQQWKSFKESKRRTVTFRTIIEASNEVRRAYEREHLADDFDDLPVVSDYTDDFEDLEPDYDLDADKEVMRNLDGIPKHLLTVPGVLGDLVTFYNAMSMKMQPQFAVQTALALGSVICSRNHTTEWNNYTSLYFVNVISSSSGKEMIDSVISQMLEEAGLTALLGPSDYTSDEGLFGTLLNHGTRKISVIDEFAEFMKAIKSQTGPKATVVGMILKLFSKLDKRMQGKAFSLQGKSAEEIKKSANRSILRPALTMIGMSPPTEFANSLSLGDASNGFLNRLIVVRSPIQFQFSRYPVKIAPPQRVVKWMKETAGAHGDTDEMISVRIGNEPTMAPEPLVMPFGNGVPDFLIRVDRELTIAQRKIKEEKFQVIKGRTREKAIRVAMIVALSCRSNTIELEHINWAYDYVNFYDEEMLNWFTSDLGQGRITRVAARLNEIVMAAGEDGVYHTTLLHRCAEYRGLDSDRDRQDVLKRLETDFAVKLVRGVRKRGKEGSVSEKYVSMRVNR